MAERRQDKPLDRNCAVEELRPLVDMYDLRVDDKKITIPQNPDYGVLYNDGEIRFDDIAEISAGLAFIHVLVRDDYLFSFYRRNPLITCTRQTSRQ